MNYRKSERPVNKSPGLSRLFEGQTPDSTIPYHSQDQTDFEKEHFKKFVEHLYQVTRNNFSWVPLHDAEEALANGLEKVYNALNSPDRSLVFIDIAHAFRYIYRCCNNELVSAFKKNTNRLAAEKEASFRLGLHTNSAGTLSVFEIIEIHHTAAKSLIDSGMKRILSRSEFRLLEVLTEASKNQTDLTPGSKVKNKQFIMTICRILSKKHPNVLTLTCRLKCRLKKLYKNDHFYRSAIDVLTEQQLYDNGMHPG